MQLSETFYILIVTGGFTFLGLSVRYCLRSKCDRIECGCIKIHRNTAEETNDVEQPPQTPNRQGTVDRIQYATI